MRDPDQARGAGSYERLLAALRNGEVTVSDEDAHRIAAAIAAAADRDDDYAEFVAEHAALHGLPAQLEGGRVTGRFRRRAANLLCPKRRQ